MKVRAECAPCLLKRILYETNQVDPRKAKEVMTAAIEELAKAWDPEETSTVIAAKVHRRAYDAIGSDDPYARMKWLSNDIARKLLPKAKRKVAKSKDRLRDAVLASIIGNVLDFGIRSAVDHPDGLKASFDGLWEEGLHRDDVGKMAKHIRKGTKIVYLTDNCGEIIFDTILLDELRARGAHVTLVVKGQKILTDATLEDVEALGIRKHVDAVATTEGFAVGLPIRPIPPKLKKLLAGADLIVAKGMGNYEALSDQPFKPIIYLMRTKCDPVAESIGEPMDTNVAKLFA
ncbi:MAG: ARMT1-like domain-containing protein [Methanobacteriota archaeon]